MDEDNFDDGYLDGRLHESDEGPKVDYWKSLETIDPIALKRRMAEFFSNEENLKEFVDWMKVHSQSIMKSYITALTSGNPDAAITSIHDFSMYCFIAIEHGVGVHRTSKSPIAPPIKTTTEQKEVEKAFSNDSLVDDFCKEMGIFTSDDEKPSDDKGV